MKIIDSNGLEIATPDLTKGYLKQETQTVHHDAVAGVEEVSHYETIREYPNGGKDVKKVVDVKAVPAQDAYDEEVEVQRYSPIWVIVFVCASGVKNNRRSGSRKYVILPRFKSHNFASCGALRPDSLPVYVSGDFVSCLGVRRATTRTFYRISI